ncbi:MAG: cytidine deaminase [Acetomicrobium sp.]|uniref:cytidine deaminase n=1 Tax=Acetomicrobium TaxID=49894 RepID=UPI00169E5584|nr:MULTISPECIES: cytidine deaminase [Acetomicrobium]MDI9377280.1 cytidine deaminase [Synergistota bacterium]NLI43430.1 cytidine deaminase [Synergistaceae bacterium]MDR9769198.1 cytidine deaminase [Acetomicrobium sp.]HOB10530.1 cytidine deaminase [Acetomicrobium sp.]HQA37204.1 cytidine deaminase [Acetomicrobium sp.]
MDITELYALAKKVRENAYAPYSGFKVGAALFSESGKIYVGCNVENASYGLTICAERAAIYNAISKGERAFKAIVICSDETNPVPPCGACLQVMAEFGDFDVFSFNLEGKFLQMRLSDLLPYTFRLFNRPKRPS